MRCLIYSIHENYYMGGVSPSHGAKHKIIPLSGAVIGVSHSSVQRLLHFLPLVSWPFYSVSFCWRLGVTSSGAKILLNPSQFTTATLSCAAASLLSSPTARSRTLGSSRLSMLVRTRLCTPALLSRHLRHCCYLRSLSPGTQPKRQPSPAI